MRTLIIGAGETGYHIAQELSSEKMEVTLIDENPTHLLAAQKELNVACVRGNGTSLSVLEQAGIEKSDLLIAATDQDETNLICCLLANHYGVETKIAITKTGSFFKPTLISKYLESGISQIINSSMVAAQEILDTAGFASAAEVSAFGEKNVLLIGYKVKPDSPLEGKELIGLRSEALDQFLIGSIVREGESFIPSGKDRILAGDYVYILVPREKQEMLNQFLKVQVNRSRRAVVAGSGQTALRVAEGLIKSHYEVTLIIGEQEHPDIKRKILNNKNFHMIRGDAESVRLQLQLDVPVAALFIAATKDDFVNIAASVVARYLGAQKTIALVNKEELAEAARDMGIDLAGATAAVQGFGNVSQYAIRLYQQLGGKVIAVATVAALRGPGKAWVCGSR